MMGNSEKYISVPYVQSSLRTKHISGRNFLSCKYECIIKLESLSFLSGCSYVVFSNPVKTSSPALFPQSGYRL